MGAAAATHPVDLLKVCAKKETLEITKLANFANKLNSGICGNPQI
jgi:hypothetical protein